MAAVIPLVFWWAIAKWSGARWPLWFGVLNAVIGAAIVWEQEKAAGRA
ncbi:MAG TPA: hypothetical protein VJV75_03735 [Candidatus Polarisedimenticolia bacterium]|nr:hypothetical protein [Candidatus Polarisedimenticolia bacterium]